MISASALNASSVPLNKSPQMSIGLDNNRLRVDSQKFLVPSLPVSSRQLNPRAEHHSHSHNQHPHNPHLHYQQHNGGNRDDSKRRERSILNGTAHPIPPPESRLSAGGMPAHNLNGHRRPSSPLGGKGTSPNYPHMQSSPRKDAHSPMYAGEVPGFNGSPGSNYSARSSVPIPCSSPSPGASASPKSSSHSLSPNSGSTYPPHLPPGLSSAANGASELSQLAVAAAAAAAASGGRLYSPGFPPPSAAHHAAFYAAAAAAAGHSLPYPGLFGSPYPPHQHPAAAASSYLDFHSKLLRNSAAAAAAAADLRSPSQSPPSRSYHQSSQQAQPPPHILQPLGSPQNTSVTSLHTKLIESVSTAGDRYHPHHTGHNHIHTSNPSNHHGNHSRFNQQPQSCVSKGGPLGISGGIMGLTISPNSNSPHKGHSGSVATSATAEMSSKSVGGKLYMEHPGLPGNNSGNNTNHSTSQQERKLLAEMEMLNGNKSKESMMAKQRMLTRSPDDFSGQQPPHKIAKSISFANDVHSSGIHRSHPHMNPYMNGHVQSHHQSSHPHHHSQHTHAHHHPSAVPTNLSTDKRASTNLHSGPPSAHSGATNQHQNHLFLPPSPKKRSAHWNFAVPQSPVHNGKMGDHHPPPSDSVPESLLNTSPSKYLSQNQQNQKPSNGCPGPTAMAGGGGGAGNGAASVATGNHYQSTNAQQLLVVPSSPLSSSSSSHGGSGPSTPKSPAVHFKFFSSTNKENNGNASTSTGRNGKVLNARNDSSSSTSSVELGIINGNGKKNGNCGPMPVEQMPLITAFRKGSLIKLASGDLKAVEDLKEDDFEKAVQLISDSVKIVHCPVVSIQENADSSLCKVTLAMGAAQNQQVVVESSPEQPFFIRGRGWSSSSPKLTEKVLQLPCTTLAVGDICITLTRHVRTQSNSVSSGGPGNHSRGRGSKSKSGATRPYGTYSKSRNSSTSSILKSSHQLQQRSNNSVTNGTRTNGRKLVSGQTNLDVSNSSSRATVGNNANLISRQTEKIMSSSDKDERQPKTEKEVEFSQPISTTVTSPTTSLPNTTNFNGGPVPTENIKPVTASTPVAAAQISYKRKSISPIPLGSERKGENDKDDASMNPPNSKKRRWSAPEQIEVESQQTKSFEDSSQNSSEKTITATTSVNPTTPPPPVSDVSKEECGSQENCQSQGKGNKDCVDPQTSNDHNSPKVPGEA